jgi:D-glycero-D-manno-heptose 1,7-bisphosphate phosphatase
MGNINRKIPAIFLDKDGVINRDNYNFKYQSIKDILPEVFEAIKKINQSGFLCVLVTNQPAVAKGFVTLDKLKKDLDYLEYKLGSNNCYLDRIYFCPCHPEKGFIGEVRKFKKVCN